MSSMDTNTKIKAPLYLTGAVQNYAWGKVGSRSLVALLSGSASEDAPYAELWLGAHPKGPALAQLGDSAYPLNQVIEFDPQAMLGQAVCSQFNNQLPLLLKVLSIAEPLSIQAHPTTSQAQKLHATNSANYPDCNHKPELAIALTPCSLLHGFKTKAEIAVVLKQYPELNSLAGEAGAASAEKDLAEHARTPASDLLGIVFENLMHADAATIAKHTQSMMARVQADHAPNLERQWLLKLYDLYPKGDVGLFCLLLMNLVTLKPSEAIFTGPETPHAYLEGDMLECMANSDNTVRAGLTPKYIDSETLLEILNFKQEEPALVELKTAPLNTFAKRYDTPACEFFVEAIEGNLGQQTYQTANKPILVFALKGLAEIESNNTSYPLKTGDTLFIPACLDHFVISTQSAQVFVVGVP
ncbi:mannose-6-phosphate isomerase, class I [Oligoflexia bacterium]|nr:mannose-6-phosphate isomerase, class I [Oligoflexia bacterium]